MTALAWLIIAAIAFVGTHFLLSHPLRAATIRMIGERGFAGAYSLIALIILWWISRAYGPASAEAPQPLWDGGKAGWIVATLLMWLGSILFVGSLRRNPAFPRPGKPVTKIDEPRGVFAITRHPMNIGFALWALVHAIVNPVAAALIVSAAIVILAIGGSFGQDVKKERLIGGPWRDWKAKTSFIPFGRGFALPDGFAFIAGTILWLAATWAHGALGYRPAGIWAF
ncbi:MAG: MFS transporter [Sphingomonas sp.]|uniref:NnrU family protein n=1 Tax=Sphingomonas sp. TaxID=28214 RepID=UPI0017C08B0E|nr:NnrU family protein [Sphingomonas sp.]MBA3668326.1 MFS transporter [Sphingomonas sp.]